MFATKDGEREKKRKRKIFAFNFDDAIFDELKWINRERINWKTFDETLGSYPSFAKSCHFCCNALQRRATKQGQRNTLAEAILLTRGHHSCLTSLPYPTMASRDAPPCFQSPWTRTHPAVRHAPPRFFHSFWLSLSPSTGNNTNFLEPFEHSLCPSRSASLPSKVQNPRFSPRLVPSKRPDIISKTKKSSRFFLYLFDRKRLSVTVNFR